MQESARVSKSERNQVGSKLNMACNQGGYSGSFCNRERGRRGWYATPSLETSVAKLIRPASGVATPFCVWALVRVWERKGE